MAERFDEPAVDLAPLERDTAARARRIQTALARRILGETVRQTLARWAVPALVAAAASIAVVVIGSRRPSGDAFAAFVVPRGPAAAWVVLGRQPDIEEVVAMAGDGR